MKNKICKICKKCKQNKKVVFSGDGVQYPTFSCGCGEDNQWKEWWKKYSDRFTEKENWTKPIEQPSCIIGYFCYLYRQTYGFNYTLDYSNPVPYLNKDFTMARRLMAMFSNDGLLIRNYMKWFFSRKAKGKKMKSMGLMIYPDVVNEYKIAKSRAKILRRSTPLPKNFINWASAKYPEILKKHELYCWNDLNRLVSYVKDYGENTEEGQIILEAVKRKMLKEIQQIKLED